ncbi:HutD family protein [Herbaspirillum lusitanum]|jgi:environmental stress-induced protein Ves|uniref:HutD family protein n=1 Tax=Herbaspirillum lusitanum TaxID=213312 RepID=A0ABW9AH14_9BURK
MPSEARQAVAALDSIVSLQRLLEIPAQSWKNQGGSTRELHVEPPDSDFNSFIWRASVADVDADVPFSTFDGVARTIVLLAGDGFEIQVDGAKVHELSKAFQPFSFAGEAALNVRLYGGGTLDFNLMVRRSDADGEVVVLNEQNSRRLPAATVLLYMASGAGRLTTPQGAQQSLRAGDVVRFHEGVILPELICASGAAALAVRIHRKRRAEPA